ncbi:helix-turn-helix domain-containing protein [Streptosporangium sp. NPDC004631]
MRSAVIDGGKLRKIRDERELSGPLLASLLSVELGRTVHVSTIYRIEGGSRQPSAKMFGALSRILRCQRSELLVAPPEQAP